MKFAFLFVVFIPFFAGSSTVKPNLEPPDFNFEPILAKYGLPGLSIAIVDDYKIVYAGSFGKKRNGDESYNVDIATAFGGASISKVITALIVVKLAEQNLVDLDAPVNQYLRRWKLPKSQFTINKPITLRHLLTHTGGINQSGFSAYFTGDEVPTLVESLNGKKLKKPVDPISVNSIPGSSFRYSGGGFVIAQLAIEDLTGESLAHLAKKMLFEPLGMSNSTLQQYGSSGFLTNVAMSHNSNEIGIQENGYPVYPQSGAAGLWTNPSDMAKLMIDIQKALIGNTETVISSWVAKETTRIHTLHKAGGWGLGWMRHLAIGDLEWFSHSGYGAGTGGQIMATLEGGRAIAVFGNGPHQARVPVIDHVIETVVKTLNWSRPIAKETANETNQSKFHGHFYNINGGFFSPFNEVVSIYSKNGELYLDNSFGTKEPLLLLAVQNKKYRISEFVNAQIGLYRGDIAFYHPNVDTPSTAMVRLDSCYGLPYEIARKEGYKAALRAYKAWRNERPNTLLTRLSTFKRLAQYELDNGRHDEALTFYRLALYFYPQVQELRTIVAELDEKPM